MSRHLVQIVIYEIHNDPEAEYDMEYEEDLKEFQDFESAQRYADEVRERETDKVRSL